MDGHQVVCGLGWFLRLGDARRVKVLALYAGIDRSLHANVMAARRQGDGNANSDEDETQERAHQDRLKDIEMVNDVFRFAVKEGGVNGVS